MCQGQVLGTHFFMIMYFLCYLLIGGDDNHTFMMQPKSLVTNLSSTVCGRNLERKLGTSFPVQLS